MKKVAWILLIIGGLNWGLVGIAGLDVVAYLPELVARIVYVLVGISALVLVFKKCDGGCKTCGTGASSVGGDSNM